MNATKQPLTTNHVLRAWTQAITEHAPDIAPASRRFLGRLAGHLPRSVLAEHRSLVKRLHDSLH